MSILFTILLDQYRELSSRKIFWLSLILSLLLVVAYASIGFSESGVSILFGLYSFESEFINTETPLGSVFYKGIFVTFIVGFWLAWAAAILALISTASIFPDLVASGSIDLMLSKPVSRVTVFAAKYLAGLLFAMLQVSVVCVGVFLALGWRLGEWNWMIFVAVPIVVIFFSYLFCISTLAGLVSRSAITGLLMALLFWFMIFSVQAAESIIHMIKMEMVVSVERSQEEIDSLTASLGALDDSEGAAGLRQQLQAQISTAELQRDDQQSGLEKLKPWHNRVEAILLPLPKTGQTIGLLDRWLVREGDIGMQELLAGNFRFDENGNIVPLRPPATDTERRLQEEYHSKSLWHVIGTSLIFEAFVLLLAGWIFSRRDF